MKYSIKSTWKSTIILLIGLLLTIMATLYTHKSVESYKKEELQIVCNEIANKISTRLLAHSQLLRSGAAYFSGSDTVTRNEWKTFYEREKINNTFPGFQGIGYSKLIPKAQLKQHIANTRSNGFPNYTIKPEGDREIYSSIIFLEPFEGRNLRAFGYDMFSERIRRSAMEIARDKDLPALSGGVTLVQETNKDIQVGTLMYVPIYKNGMPISNVSERRKAFIGWVYSPYRMNDLMFKILGNQELNKNGRIHLQIYDENISKERLLFDSQKEDPQNIKDEPNRSFIIPINFYGKKWVLQFSQSRANLPFFYDSAILVLFSGIIISLLLFTVTLVLFNTRQRAEHIAKKLTAELSESERKLNTFIENSSDAFGVHVNGIWVMCNPPTLRLFRIQSQDELIGKSILEVVAEDEREKILDYVKKRNDNNEAPTAYLTRGLRKDGTEFDLEVSVSSFILDDIRHNYFTLRDITSSNLQKLKLERSEQNLKKAQQIAQIGNWTWHIQENRIEWSDQMYQIYDLNKEDFTGSLPELIGNYIHPDDREMMKQNVQKLNLSSFEHRIVLKDTSIRFLRVINGELTFDKDGKPVLLTGTTQEITERKMAEIALTKSEEKYRLLAENATDTVYIYNATTGRISYTSPSVYLMLGYTSEEAIQQGLDGLFTEDSKQLIINKITERIGDFMKNTKKEDIYIDELQQIGKDGKVIWVEASTKFHMNTKGEIEIIGSFRNIELRKKLECRIQEKNDRLNDLVKTKDKFFGIIAHDLRNPFNGILVLSNLIVKNVKRYSKEETYKFVELINNEAKNTYKLLENLLEWANIQTGRIEFKPEKLKLEILLLETIAMLRNNSDAKNIKIQYKIPENQTIIGDNNMLNTVMRNLLSNAIKFTDSEGSIIITAKQAKDKIEISVEDTGIGMSEETRNKLFQMNHKISLPGTKQETGTGLGLILCKEFIAKHNGEIWVESKLGKGSKFSFTLENS